MFRMAWMAVFVAGLGILAGCSDKPRKMTLSEERKAELEELGHMLKTLAEEGRKPPTKLAELEPVEPMIPVASPAIRNGDIVYIWGVGYASGGANVVAYDKSVATEGGYVLLQDGTVKEMSANEFQSAPKAQK